MVKTLCCYVEWHDCLQWRTQDFRMGRVEGSRPHTGSEGWGVRMGYPLLTEGRVWRGGCPQEIFRILC